MWKIIAMILVAAIALFVSSLIVAAYYKGDEEAGWLCGMMGGVIAGLSIMYAILG
jgi:hypothetical protein